MSTSSGDAPQRLWKRASTDTDRRATVTVAIAAAHRSGLGRRLHRSAACLLAWALASGCSGGTAPDADEGVRPDSYNSMLEWYVTRLNVDEAARQERIQACMEARGFDYVIDPDKTQMDLKAAVSPIDHSTSELLLAEARDEATPATTIAQPPGFDEALGSESTWVEGDGTCFSEASSVETSSEFSEVEAAIQASFETLPTDPDYQSASEAWASCMTDAGFAVEGDYSGATARLADSFALERFTELGADTSSGDLVEVVLTPETRPSVSQLNSVATEVATYETEVGRASETCAAESGLQEVLDQRLALVAQEFDPSVFKTT